MVKYSGIKSDNPEEQLGVFAEQGRALFVPIDVQQCFLTGLHADRASLFPKQVSDFSALLNESNIQTTWVECIIGCLGLPYGCKGNRPNCENVKMPSNGLACKRTHGDVFVKCTDNAFESGKWVSHYWAGQKDFEKGLAEKEVSTLILAGMNTTLCVLRTAVGAVARGYSVVFVSDLLADDNYHESERDPAWHRNILHKRMRQQDPSSYVVATQEQVLSAFVAPGPDIPIFKRMKRALKDFCRS